MASKWFEYLLNASLDDIPILQFWRIQICIKILKGSAKQDENASTKRKNLYTEMNILFAPRTFVSITATSHFLTSRQHSL